MASTETVSRPNGAPNAHELTTDEAEALKMLDEVVALRELARVAEHVFEAQGIGFGHGLTPLEILDEALRCAQSDFAIIGDAQSGGSSRVDSMVFRRAELRIDLALALANYRERFGITDSDEAVSP